MRIITLTLALLLAASTAVEGFEFAGTVTWVYDGDTVQVTDTGGNQFKVRLWACDAPEFTQAGAEGATGHLTEQAQGKECVVKVHKCDRYSRLVGDVLVDHRSLCEEMIVSGWAWHYSYFSNNETWTQAETKAREAKIGIWSEAGEVIAPWTWRRTHPRQPKDKVEEPKLKNSVEKKYAEKPAE
ncbi:MAG: thermonuclease family protein [Planctomycetia bacterium]|nr:thermonuclease family protein [Planctomycetia bacterium]